jgi:hypothetical protein
VAAVQEDADPHTLRELAELEIQLVIEELRVIEAPRLVLPVVFLPRGVFTWPPCPE